MSNTDTANVPLTSALLKPDVIRGVAQVSRWAVKVVKRRWAVCGMGMGLVLMVCGHRYVRKVSSALIRCHVSYWVSKEDSLEIMLIIYNQKCLVK